MRKTINDLKQKNKKQSTPGKDEERNIPEEQFGLAKKQLISGGKPHPHRIGHHGTDKEKDLNPEE